MHGLGNPESDAASGRSRDSSVLPASEEILERQSRLAGFQAAWNALTPFIGEEDANNGHGLGRELHERLEGLRDQLQSAQDWPRDAEAAARETDALCDALDRLDADLDRYAARLCSHLEGGFCSGLRSDAFAPDAAQHSGIASLVDFILGVDPELARHSIVVDLLVTLLSTGEQAGRRCVVCDPTALTPKLQSLSEHAATNSDLDLSKVEREFVEAAGRCEGGRSDELLREMDARKTALGRTILAPQILRAVVFFNAAAWNDGRDGSGCSAQQLGETAVPEAQAPIAADGGESRTEIATAVPDHPTTGDPGCESDSSADPAGAVAAAGVAPDVSDVHWRIDPAAAEGPPAELPNSTQLTRMTHLRPAAAAASLVAALLLASLLWWSSPAGTVQTLSEVDLRAISTQLDSGYRSPVGTGTVFVGTVGSEWRKLSSDERKRSAQEIVSRLGRSGLREILVYDESRRIALHSADGLPLRIEP